MFFSTEVSTYYLIIQQNEKSTQNTSFVFRATSIYACLNLSRLVIPSFEPRYLNLGCKMLLGGAGRCHIQNIRSVVILKSVHLLKIF